MKIPYEVEQVIGCFYPGSNDGTNTLEEWVESVVRFHRNEKQKAVIASFLDEILSGKYSDRQLGEIWDSAHPSYKFSDGGHRIFFSLIRDAIEREENSQ